MDNLATQVAKCYHRAQRVTLGQCRSFKVKLEVITVTKYHDGHNSHHIPQYSRVWTIEIFLPQKVTQFKVIKGHPMASKVKLEVIEPSHIS